MQKKQWVKPELKELAVTLTEVEVETDCFRPPSRS